MIKDLSYRETSNKVEKLLGISTSPSAAHNWVQELRTRIAKEAERERYDLFEYGVIPENEGKRQEIEHLFFEVDGMHLSLRKEEKNSGELKLGMSYQGWEKRHPMSEKYNLTGKRYYGGVFASEQFWGETTADLYKHYKFDKKAVTVLNGDGAEWVTTGREYRSDLSAGY